MLRSEKIKQVHDHLREGDADKVNMHDLEFFKYHFEELYRLLNISGPEFRPAFEYAIKQFSRADDIIRARLRKD